MAIEPKPNIYNPELIGSKWILGLTGGICCGKTTASAIFAELGCTVVDADISARGGVAPKTPGLEAIKAHFGTKILNSDGTLNRRALRDIIFFNEAEKQFLNQLLHPLIKENILHKLKTATGCYTVLAAPLLFENKLERIPDFILCMDIDEETQIQRVCARDGSSRAIAEAIIKSQLPRSYKNAHSNIVLESNFPQPQDMAQKIHALHQDFLQLASLKEKNNDHHR